MRLTTKGRYGVRAVINLAAAVNGHPVSISKIAAKEGISPEFLEQIFFKLKKSGLIRSLRGPKGGFLLDKDPALISIKDILDAVGEPVFPTPCTNKDAKQACIRQDQCSITQTWQNFSDLIEDFLSGVTLKELIKN
jgi:Rrf2 family iron-sulfur cluster assembly transcriptional regulator